jgi:hypothetical protein
VCSEFGQYCSSLAFLVGWLVLAPWFLDVAYCCLIQLCKVEVSHLQLGLLVLLHWVVICFLLLFDSTLQGWGPASVVGPIVTVCVPGVALLSFSIHRWVSVFAVAFLHCLTGLLQYIFILYFFFCNVVCSEYGRYCSLAAFLVHWFLLARCLLIGFLFAYCCCCCCHSPLTGGFHC